MSPSTPGLWLTAELSCLGNFNRDFFLVLPAFTAVLFSVAVGVEMGVEGEEECILLKCCFSVTLLEQLPVFMDKSQSRILQSDILPMLYLALESSMSQVQMAAVSVVPAILDYVRWGFKKKMWNFP